MIIEISWIFFIIAISINFTCYIAQFQINFHYYVKMILWLILFYLHNLNILWYHIITAIN